MKVTSQKPQKSTSTKQPPSPSGWQNLINSLLRPPRMHYNESHMGTKIHHHRLQDPQTQQPNLQSDRVDYQSGGEEEDIFVDVCA